MNQSSIRRLWLAALAVALAAAVSFAAAAATPRLKVSANGRCLIQHNGRPFFWNGDTNWRLYKLTRQQVDQYLNNRKAKGFNVIQGPELLHSQVTSETTNAYGAVNTNPAQPSHAWFEHIDYIVDAADARGMYIALVVTWGHNWDLFSSNAQARNFGKWLGARYKNNSNVIWIVAGEYLIDGTSPTITARWNALGAGLRAGSQGKNLITVHGSYQPGRQSSAVKFHNKNWLDFNMVHSSQSGDTGSGADNWSLVAGDWNRSPAKPTIDGEAHYERVSGWNAFGVRRRAYWSVFAGAFGHTYGAASVWQSYRPGLDASEFGSAAPWQNAMQYAGASDMKHLRRLIESRPMLRRRPAQDIVISHAGGVPTRIQATRDGLGRFAMIYIPQSGKQFTVNMGAIAGPSAKAWWFNPRNGKAAAIGTFPASASREFTTPATGPDWVLVLDSSAKNYPRPGVGGPRR